MKPEAELRKEKFVNDLDMEETNILNDILLEAEENSRQEEQKRILEIIDKAEKCYDCTMTLHKDRCISIIPLKEEIKRGGE